jgi:anoctamin-4
MCNTVNLLLFQHIVFALTGIMAYAIPDIPAEVRTQIQREKLLEKEAKYEHGTQGNLNANYGEMLLAQRERSLAAAAGAARSWWGRRLSRVSDSLDAQETSRQQKVNNSNSTVWEVTR